MFKRFCVALICSSAAVAAQADPANVFVSFAVGSADQEISVDNFGSASESNTTIGVRGGYLFHFDRFYVGPELSYSENGDFASDIEETDIESESLNLGLKAGFHLVPEKLALVGRLGLSLWEVSVDSVLGDGERDGEDPYFGLGLEYQIVENLVLGASYTMLQFDLDDLTEYEITTPELYFEIRF